MRCKVSVVEMCTFRLVVLCVIGHDVPHDWLCLGIAWRLCLTQEEMRHGRKSWEVSWFVLVRFGEDAWGAKRWRFTDALTSGSKVGGWRSDLCVNVGDFCIGSCSMCQLVVS